MIDLKEIRDYLPKRSNASMEAGTTAPLHEIYLRFLLEEVDRLRAENAELKEDIGYLEALQETEDM